MAVEKKILTTRDLKRMFNVSKTSIYNWRKEGLEWYKLGGNGLSDPVRYDLDKVKEFCEKTGKQIVNPIFIPNSNASAG